MIWRGRVARGWRALGALGLAGALGTVLWMHPRTLAREDSSEEQKPPARSTRASARSDAACGRSDIQAKFDTVFDNQQVILSRFKQVMDELQIIKIRASR